MSEFVVSEDGADTDKASNLAIPIFDNAAEHATAVVMAGKKKMNLAIGVVLKSGIQIALFATRIIVALGWCLRKGMSLYFSLFDTISLITSIPGEGLSGKTISVVV